MGRLSVLPISLLFLDLNYKVCHLEFDKKASSDSFMALSRVLLKKEINKTLSEPQRKVERPCAWPTLYLEINGNTNDNVELNKKDIHITN